MIDAGIVKSVNGGDLRMPGRKTRPDLAPDKTSAALPVGVFQPARNTCRKPAGKIGFRRSVFRPSGVNIGKPVLRKDIPVDLRPEFHSGVQPHDLKIQIVVRRRIFFDVFLHVKGHVVRLS